jgi:DNA-binding SARP family transcriptional activator
MPTMPNRPRLGLVDSPGAASVSFAPPDPVTLGPRRKPTRAPIAVGPERAETAAPNRVNADRGSGVSYPIQPGKVQAPAVRDETLARTRLLDWLEAKIHSRVLFVIADAGYGKTTLLADFSRRTRLRTLWYRLDEDDRDWVGFLSHLVAAGREHDSQFAPRTASLLRSLEPGGVTREDAIASFLAELPSIAADGAALIFDDFHLADEVSDIRVIIREIVSRSPDRLSIVFASRRQPPVPVSKLRTIGELAELGIADLRFSDGELEQLFRETYRRPLEPDVLSELSKRTEGWAASLTLVQAALRERSPSETRSFVRGLSGARDELHDYLAEEVVGDLPLIHQQFLMRTSVLQTVTPELAQVATGLTAIEVQSLMLESERLGLLGQRPNRRSSAQRYHPLVREFLEERLRREIGAAGVDELHVAVARWAESTDWRTAAHHFASARRWPDLQRVLDTYVETIVASGAFTVAADLLRRLPDSSDSATAHVILSREASAVGDYASVTAHAEIASRIAPDLDVVIGNLVSAKVLLGSFSEASTIANRWAASTSSGLQRDIAEALVVVIAASLAGSLADVIESCERLADKCANAGLHHFEGVSWLNAALAHVASGSLDRAADSSAKAAEALSNSSSGAELASALSLGALVVGLKGDVPEARRRFSDLLQPLTGGSRTEILTEAAELEVLVGDADSAESLLPRREPEVGESTRALTSLLQLHLLARRGAFQAAYKMATRLVLDEPTANLGFQSRLRAYKALSFALVDRPGTAQVAEEAIRFAARQGAKPWMALAEIARSHATDSMSSAVIGLAPSVRFVLSLAAELVVHDLDRLDDQALDVARDAITSAPERWRDALRREVSGRGPARLRAARLLDEVGQSSDVITLRRVAKEPKRTGQDRQLGRGLARRLAERVHISDLGRISISVGETVIGAGEIRRKVLALLSFLLTRPRWAATREEVMEAMWPDMDPASAINSLNQSVYFLRRVFEREYSEDTTAGYVHQDSDLLWLDPDLVQSASRDCASLVADYVRAPRPEVALELAERYRGRFALDFAYDDWSADFREWLHVAYLQVVETQIRSDVDAGQYARGIRLARSALEIEPRNEDLALSLLRLLRGSGAHSAAAEQYAHYATILRADLGIEPPPLETL